MTPSPGVVASDLEVQWAGLPVPQGTRLSAERVRDWAGGQVLAALDASGTRHLLIRSADDEPARLPRPAAGLDISVRRLHPVGQPDVVWVDLALSDEGWSHTFSALCADVVTELPADGSPDAAALFAVVERWRRFWSAARDGLSRDEQLGLLGELWFLLEWAPGITVASLSTWQGPLKGRHDFVSARVSVEVKTTRASTGPVVHHVTRLDQLDEPGDGQLYLLSLRAVPDPLGAVTLDALLTRAWDAANRGGLTCEAFLGQRLAALGVTRSDAGRYTEPFRVALQELYEVGSHFPRLIPASFPHGLPPGVQDVAYTLDTSACRPWLVATDPAEAVDVLSALD